MERGSYNKRHRTGLFSGVVLFWVMCLLPAPEDLSQEGWYTAAVALLMAVWWITEALPIPVTALLPIVLLPVLDVTSITEATTPYANPLIFLFMGGFVIALAMEKSDLHRRIALNIVDFIGVQPTSIIIGFIVSSAFLSMWVSNTATALMMLPIALSVLTLVDGKKESSGKLNFEIVLVLSLAYACNIGGIGTLIGTPPNALLAGFMSENYGFEIGFARWLMVGIPIMLVGLFSLYFLLVKVIYPVQMKELPGGRELIDHQLKNLGTISSAEKKVTAVFTITALLWIFRPLINDFIPGLSDAGIAIGAAVSLFIIPVNFKEGEFILVWTDTKKLPWGVLILFGGGLSLASAIGSTGLAEWIGGGVSVFEEWPVFLLMGLAVLLIIFLTEITSNTATAAAFLPILASVAIGLGENPLLLAVPAAMGASCAFMLPVATPPNAIVYGSGKISIPEMSKAGLWLNIVFIVILTAGVYYLIIFVFGVQTGVLPEWVGSTITE